MTPWSRYRWTSDHYDAKGGDGIDWYIDYNNLTLAHGGYPDGGSQDFSAGTGAGNLSTISVKQGDTLYFIVDPKSTYYHDSTRLDITITPSSTPPPTSTPEAPSSVLFGAGAAFVLLVLGRRARQRRPA